MLAGKLYLNEGTGQECALDRYSNAADIRYKGGGRLWTGEPTKAMGS